MQYDNNGMNGIAADGEALRQERDRLCAELEACRYDLRQARFELAQAREIQESLEERLHASGEVASAAVTATPRNRPEAAWPVKVWQRVTMSADRRALQQEVDLLRQSTLFDPEWYLAEYPDVANEGLDPAEHYLRFGAHEGRDPGPQFSTGGYLRDHPDAVERGINPLVHFLGSGYGTGA